MPRIDLPEAYADPRVEPIFKEIEGAFGKVPNLLARRRWRTVWSASFLEESSSDEAGSHDASGGEMNKQRDVAPMTVFLM